MTLNGNSSAPPPRSRCPPAPPLADPALIFDLGGKFDKLLQRGRLQRRRALGEETGGSYRDIEMQSEAQREQALRRFAEAGANPIVMTGFAFNVLEEVAPDYPDTKFAIIDGLVDQPNVRSVVFNEHEGSYLVGMLAGDGLGDRHGRLRRRHGHPADPPFGCGYAQGVKAVNPDATVIANLTGTTPAAWNDPVRGGEIAKARSARAPT
jgi:basic membrane protein A and related proteins